MLSCIKTGFYAVTPSGLYLYGDAFVLTSPANDQHNCGYGDDERTTKLDHLLLRITSASVETPPQVHIDLHTWDHWFDEQRGDVVSPAPDFGAVWSPNSTLIASPGQWTWLGYYGKATS